MFNTESNGCNKDSSRSLLKLKTDLYLSIKTTFLFVFTTGAYDFSSVWFPIQVVV